MVKEEGALLFITNSPAPPRLCRATGAAAAAAAVGVLDAYRASSHFQQSSSSKQLVAQRSRVQSSLLGPLSSTDKRTKLTTHPVKHPCI